MLNFNTIIKANYGHGFQTIAWHRNHNWEVEHEDKHYVLLENAEMVSCCATDGSVEWKADAICLEDSIEDGFIPSYSVYFSPIDGWEKFCDNNDESRCCDWDTPDRIEEYHVVKVE